MLPLRDSCAATMSFLRRKAVSRIDLARDLRAAGIERGETLVVHSALGKVGWILGGPIEMIRSFQEVLGPGGTLVMPTFSFSLAGWSQPPFDAWKTASRVGKLTDVFWRQPEVFRTHHPSHSIAAWGRHAEAITRGPIDYEPIGHGSPLDRARELDARILLIGVGHNRNSTVHLAEARADMPYLSVCFTIDADHDEAWYIDEPGGPPRELQINSMPGSSEGFEKLDEMLHNMGVTRRIHIGEAPTWLMESQRLCDTVEDMLRENPLLLLHSSNPSEITRKRLQFMEQLAPQRPLAARME